jgi:hypothetical protein
LTGRFRRIISTAAELKPADLQGIRMRSARTPLHSRGRAIMLVGPLLLRMASDAAIWSNLLGFGKGDDGSAVQFVQPFHPSHHRFGLTESRAGGRSALAVLAIVCRTRLISS